MSTNVTSLLARLLVVSAGPLACTPSSSTPPATDPPTGPPSAATSPPSPATTPASTSPPATTTAPLLRADSTPPVKDGPPSTGGSSTNVSCYTRASGETCLAPETAATAKRLELKVDGTVKHLTSAPGTDTTCCYSIQSVSKGRALAIGGSLRLAALVRRAYA